VGNKGEGEMAMIGVTVTPCRPIFLKEFRNPGFEAKSIFNDLTV
jgi:hypothetical protein